MSKVNTASVATQSRDDIANAIAMEIMNGLGKPSGLSISDRVLQYGANKIADAGTGVAEIIGGFSAAADNYEIAKNAAMLRQKQRTALKVAHLVELEMKNRGL